MADAYGAVPEVAGLVANSAVAETQVRNASSSSVFVAGSSHCLMHVGVNIQGARAPRNWSALVARAVYDWRHRVDDERRTEHY